MSSEDRGGAVAAAVRRTGPLAGAVLLAPAVVAALPLWSVSALTRWLARQPWLEAPASTEPLTEYVPRLGVRARPHLDTVGRAEDVFTVTTDADGYRGQGRLEDADVLVFGDSFAFGYGVDDRDCLTEHCAGVRVKAIASPARSMVHAVLEMRALADQLRGRPVVWLVYCGNDLSDNLHPNLGPTRVPFVRMRRGASWEIVTEHVSPEPWTFGSARRDNDRLFAELCRPSTFRARVFGAADHLIAEAAALCRSAGSPLTVLSIPPTSLVKHPEAVRSSAPDADRVDLDAADRLLAASCATHDVAFVPLRPRLDRRHYFADDMHWNSAGHRVAAAAVTEVVAGSAVGRRRGRQRAAAAALAAQIR